MKIVKESMVSGKTHEMEIPVTQEQLERWNDGFGSELIQNIMPNLTPDQREFIKTGITPEEWARIFGDDE